MTLEVYCHHAANLLAEPLASMNGTPSAFCFFFVRDDVC